MKFATKAIHEGVSPDQATGAIRSEERRVGKEWSSDVCSSDLRTRIVSIPFVIFDKN